MDIYTLQFYPPICDSSVKLVSAIFYRIFIFFPKWQSFKNWKMFFLFYLKSSFPSRDIQVFPFLSSLFRVGTSRDGTPPPSPPGFSEGTPPFWVPPLSEANLKSYPLFLRTIQIGACKLYYMYYSLKCRCYVSYCTKSIENIIIITFYTFRLNSVFTTDSLVRYCL